MQSDFWVWPRKHVTIISALQKNGVVLQPQYNYSFSSVQLWAVSGCYWHTTGDNKIMLRILYGTKSPVTGCELTDMTVTIYNGVFVCVTQASAKRAGWEDPVDWIMSTCPWKDRSDFDRCALQRLRPEDVGCDNSAAAAAVTASGNSFIQPSSVESADPVVNTAVYLSIEFINKRNTNHDMQVLVQNKMRKYWPNNQHRKTVGYKCEASATKCQYTVCEKRMPWITEI